MSTVDDYDIEYVEPDKRHQCPACGGDVNRSVSSAPFVGLLRILQKCWKERHALPSELVERLREQLEGPFAHKLKAEQAVLDAWGALTDEQLHTIRGMGWRAEMILTVDAELARRRL